MTRALGILALAGVAGTGVAFAGSSSAPLSVSVTVTQACAIDTRFADNAAPLRLTCTSGAGSNLKISETLQPATAVAVAEGRRILTLNF